MQLSHASCCTWEKRLCPGMACFAAPAPASGGTAGHLGQQNTRSAEFHFVSFEVDLRQTEDKSGMRGAGAKCPRIVVVKRRLNTGEERPR
eukprot:1557628-Pleurochrysis_carterae.AAC.1